MVKYKTVFFVLLAACIFNIGCLDDDITDIPEVTEGLKPVYAQNQDWKTIIIEAPRVKRNIDGTFDYQSIEYLREVSEGLHVIDVSDSLIPTPLSFISIPGIHRVDIRADSLVVGNFLDAVVLAIGDPRNIKIGRRISNVYITDPLSELPNNYSGFFECPDESKGNIIGWRGDEITKPQCWR